MIHTAQGQKTKTTILFLVALPILAVIVFYGIFLYDSLKPNILFGEWETTLPTGDQLKLGFTKTTAWSSVNNTSLQPGGYDLKRDNQVWILVPAFGTEKVYGTISEVDEDTVVLTLNNYPSLVLNRISSGLQFSRQSRAAQTHR